MFARTGPGGFFGPLRRLGAAACAVMVLTLSALAASPQLHHWAHGDQGTGESDGCAVVLFAHGVTGAAAALAVFAGPAVWRGEKVAAPASWVRTAQRRVFPPSCGPPTA